MTLLRYAMLISGPRDFFINLAINSFIPWWVLRGIDTVPMIGNPSVLTLIVPMGFILVFFTTFFGYLNGVGKRKAGLAGPPMGSDKPWFSEAVITALRFGFIGLLIFAAIALTLALLFPEAEVRKWTLITFQAVLAAFLAYSVQVNAVLRSQRI